MELLTVKSLRDMESDVGRVRNGDILTVPRAVARQWIARNRAVLWSPVENPPQPRREIQAFIGAPEVKAIPQVTRYDNPLVTCILPTADRHRFIPGAIRNFLEQTYELKELLVLDDGKESCQHLVPEREDIRYMRMAKCTLGRKRNIGIENARGTVIVHWDDDDRSAPDRITRQVVQLVKTGAVVVGYRDVHFVDEAGKQFRMVGEAHYASGTSLCYRRDWALHHPFPDVNASEDNAFLQSAGAALVTTASESRIIARIHKGNTVKKRPGGSGWTRLEKKELPAWANI